MLLIFLLADDKSCCMYVELAYEHELYEECVRFCEEVTKKSSKYITTTTNKVALFHGKACYYIFNQDLLALKKVPKTSPQYFKEKEICLKKAKQAIRLLGDALDNNVLDVEGSHLLDTVTMLALSESSTSNRCLLCRSKQRKLVQSHICPHAVLRDFAEVCGTPEGAKPFLVNWPWQPALSGNWKSAGQISVNLLCHNCELILSKNESLFLPKFFRKFYDRNNPSYIEIGQEIEYGEWLYQFFIGLIFRGMAFQYSGGRENFLNEDEVYSVFVQCREALLNSKSGPQVSLYIAPIASTNQLELTSLINLVIHLPYQVFFTHMKSVFREIQLSSQALSYTFRIGMIMVTVNFSPAHWKAHESSIISPSKGTFRVPPNSDRHQTIPDALWETLLIKAIDMEKQMMEQPQRKIIPVDSTPSTSFMKSIWDATSTSKREVKESFLEFHPKIINYIPSTISVIHFHEFNNPTGNLKLPSDHRVLLHLTIPQQDLLIGNTAFIVTGEGPGYGSNNPYLIFHHYEPGLQTNYGFFFSPSTFEFECHLPDHATKRFLDDGLKASGLMEKSKGLISLILKTKGFRNYQSLQYWIHAKRQVPIYICIIVIVSSK